jgi:hypothetical protein
MWTNWLKHIEKWTINSVIIATFLFLFITLLTRMAQKSTFGGVLSFALIAGLIIGTIEFISTHPKNGGCIEVVKKHPNDGEEHF